MKQLQAGSIALSLASACALLSACGSSGGPPAYATAAVSTRNHRRSSGAIRICTPATRRMPTSSATRRRPGYRISLRQGIACRSSVPQGEDPNRNATRLSRGRRPRRDDGRAAPTLSGRRNTHQDGDRKTDRRDGQSRQGPGGLHRVRRRDQRGQALRRLERRGHSTLGVERHGHDHGAPQCAGAFHLVHRLGVDVDPRWQESPPRGLHASGRRSGREVHSLQLVRQHQAGGSLGLARGDVGAYRCVVHRHPTQLEHQRRVDVQRRR